MRAIAIVLAAVLGACGEAESIETVRLNDGTTLELVGITHEDRRDDDGRVAFDRDDGLAIAVQEAAVDDREVGPRTPESVASALVQRVELGEREGELSRYECRAAGASAQCLVGHTVIDGEDFARDGFVIAAGTRIVWVDVSAPASQRDAVTTLSRAVRESVRVRSPGGT